MSIDKLNLKNVSDQDRKMIEDIERMMGLRPWDLPKTCSGVASEMT
jgi:hypothetical protein